MWCRAPTPRVRTSYQRSSSTSHGAAAKPLAQQLTHSGFTANSVDHLPGSTGCGACQHYRSMLFLGDLSDPEDVRCVVELRKRAPRTWIIMISSTELLDAEELYLRYGVDAQVIAPFSMCGSRIPVDGVLAVLTPTLTGYAMQSVRAEQTTRSCSRRERSLTVPLTTANKDWACAPFAGSAMTQKKTRLLAIAEPVTRRHTACSASWSRRAVASRTLWERIFDGTYDKPFIVDSGARRFLHFDLETVQSAMRLDDPDRLSLRYTRKMMAFLLFNRAPERILLLGLGGGSLAKFCYRRLPFTALTAVEVNPDVIALREEFRIPSDDARFRVICANAVTYVARLNQSKDVILSGRLRSRWHRAGVQCDRVLPGHPPLLVTRRRVRDQHVQRYRLLPRTLGKDTRGVWRRIHDAASETARQPHRVGIQGTPPCRDRLGGAWRLPPSISNGDIGLDFPKYVRRIALDWKLRRWGRAFM